MEECPFVVENQNRAVTVRVDRGQRPMHQHVTRIMGPLHRGFSWNRRGFEKSPGGVPRNHGVFQRGRILSWKNESSHRDFVSVRHIYRPSGADLYAGGAILDEDGVGGDRKSTRLNSSHQIISYAVFCLKKKKKHPVH